MARDYGNRSSSRHKSGSAHPLLLIVITFLLGYLTASVFDVETISHWLNTQIAEHQGVKQEPAKAEPQRAQIPPKPKFEFYTLLANEKGATQPNSSANRAAAAPATPTAKGTAAVAVAVNASAKPNMNPAAVKVTEAKPLASPQPAVKGNYLVQVASFKARPDAEQMKGMLTLKGFNVNVVPITTAQGNWFRVIVGPYPNRDMANKAQVTLARAERLHGMVRSM